jgi:hypothetical protein
LMKPMDSLASRACVVVEGDIPRHDLNRSRPANAEPLAFL